MIQRIQSVLLLIAAICMFLLAFVLPIWFGSNGNQNVSLMAMGMVLTSAGENTQIANPIIISIVAFIAGSVSIFSLLQYKNRLLQMKLGALNSIILALVFAACFYYVNEGSSKIGTPEEVQSKYMIGFYMPIVAMLMNLMANRFIRKDEKLVKSADRLR